MVVLEGRLDFANVEFDEMMRNGQKQGGVEFIKALGPWLRDGDVGVCRENEEAAEERCRRLETRSEGKCMRKQEK